MPGFTRTVGPLHFEDLEPHRFEDLVRQLAYGFRDWHSLEAIGRAGSDDGADIRALERVQSALPVDSEDHDEGDDYAPAIEERSWYIQCKREKGITPKSAARIAEEAVPGEAPFGLILAAACDFSLRARTAFRDEALSRGVIEVHMWGKAELEDMLFAQEHDLRVLWFIAPYAKEEPEDGCVRKAYHKEAVGSRTRSAPSPERRCRTAS